MVRGLGWMAGAVVTLVVLTAGADAMPLAPLQSTDGAAVTLVRDGCGPGGFRNRFGECRFRGPGFYGPRPYGPRFYGQPRFGGDDGRRCFIRETYYGPRRVCRW